MVETLKIQGQEGADSDPGIAIPGYRRELGIRIKEVLRRFSSRKEASKVALVTTEQLAAYVAGRAKPPFEVLARLAAAQSVSMEWLATGEGPMPRGEDGAHPTRGQRPGERPGVPGSAEPAGLDHVDEGLLTAAVCAVDEYLAERDLELDSARKAQLIGLLYDIVYDEEQAERPPAIAKNVTRLFKLVS